MQETAHTLFDIIDTDQRRYVGVIDYVNSKYVTFYDLSGGDPEIHHMVVVYKTYFPHMRFSMFVASYMPQYEIDTPLMINKKLIKYHTAPLKNTAPPRRVKRIEVANPKKR